MNQFKLAAEVLRQAKSVLVLTGAGISVSAGVSLRDTVEERRKKLSYTKPTLAHEILAKWEHHFPEYLLVTQNTDTLHRRAGSTRLIEIHGSLETEVVRFGEPIDTKLLVQAILFATNADVCLVVGTSARVFPAKSIPLYTKGAIIEINPERTSLSDVSIYLEGTAEELLPALSDAVTSAGGLIGNPVIGRIILENNP